MITQKQINARDEYIRYCDIPKQSGYIYMMRQIIKKIIAEADKEADDVEDTKETITKPEEAPAPSVSLPTLAGMDEAFRRHVLSVARAEFVALFWDMPNTDLAAAMGVTEKTVRNIRKKRLRKNRESI